MAVELELQMKLRKNVIQGLQITEKQNAAETICSHLN